ncbi:MAG: hypothetical protein OIN87_00720 [Candidatus Methanoperedens sp.]|nr:hypothetical protein [Candidatus Methanoperedens sp.]
MDIPTEIVAGVVVTVVTTIGSIILLLLKSLRDEFRNLTAKLDAFGVNLSKVDLVISKVLLIQSMCPNCPHPDVKIDTELELIKFRDIVKEEQ